MPKGQYNRKPFQAAETAVLEKPDPVLQGPLIGESLENTGHRPIDTAPKDGSTILLYSGIITHGVRGCWRRSRRMVMAERGARWVQNEFWACPLTNKPLGMAWTTWEPLP